MHVDICLSTINLNIEINEYINGRKRNIEWRTQRKKEGTDSCPSGHDIIL